ncbi:hypothetical protein LTR56_014236 [Elasticomyces elasticus]|nr:hypothetical protein LTR56_014236 [Elasticomyces elasticus]KAK3645291.1 hypothetical protein LTR22_014869 [Elasticomyces elasticus]KAK4917401.1 hypothetical protein LTR49_014755 [Elasticomyces elasticus]KAK4952406.1 hypothetical protein LTR10_009212 [Elasticomyces elasticus]KAK4971687.1 hypothetical protein LTR42_007415 [Elasticomyces elasticus]
MSVALPSVPNRSSSQPSGDKAKGIPEPEEAHIRDDASTLHDRPDDEREAFDLHTSGERTKRRVSRVISPGNAMRAWHDPLRKLWRHHIRLSVPHVDCRDHLANERTFLGYLRTSLALSMLGAVVAQLYRLQHSPTPSPTFGFYILSKPIAAIFQCSAICMTLLGAIRFYRQQHAMSIGKVHAGGWEILVIIALVFILLLGMTAVHIAVDIYKEG